jgi:hypothetical protein
VETACKHFHEGIHYLAANFQNGIHYIYAVGNCCPIAACKFLSKIPVFMWVVEINLKFARSSGLLIENFQPGSGYLHEIISR